MSSKIEVESNKVPSTTKSISMSVVSTPTVTVISTHEIASFVMGSAAASSELPSDVILVQLEPTLYYI